MTERSNFSTRKGQSAIEYLMTYGWMLLVVAIAGGAIFATVQDSQQSCEQSVEDIQSTQQGFGVLDFSTTSSALNIQLENNQQESVTVQYVNITNEDDETVEDISVTDGDLGFGDSMTVSTESATQSEEGCATFGVTIQYTQGNLPGEMTGSITGQMTDSS
jgi:hypothetical protein